jgi:hypothetical protein
MTSAVTHCMTSAVHEVMRHRKLQSRHELQASHTLYIRHTDLELLIFLGGNGGY